MATRSVLLFRNVIPLLFILLTWEVHAQSGCSSSAGPYLLPSLPSASIRSLLTTGDAVGGYTMVGAPDGLGAFDNGNGTFTVLMNHEVPAANGAVRAHGAKGSFVSAWVMDKTSLCVLSGYDLMQSVQVWNGTAFVAGTPAFERFCSADLAAPHAYYNASSGLGTQERIFMSGEEGGVEGRVVGHVVTGPSAGTSYQLPYLGRANWENAVARPLASDKTVVGLLDDATPGQVYFQIGMKQNSGTVIERAGLHNGHLWGVAVSGLTAEVTGSVPAAGTAFTLIDVGDVHNMTGAQLNTTSNTAGVTVFLRPEDGAWDPVHPEDFYFTTTSSFSSPSRLWRLHFSSAAQPELGGTITAVLDGSEGQKMLDNLTIDMQGRILLQEDVGNNVHLGKVWRYTIATDVLEVVGAHDPARFVSGGAAFLTEDEESSGIVDVSAILGPGHYLFDVMAHYSTTTALYQGGQLLLLHIDDAVKVAARVLLDGPYDPTTGLMNDALRVLPGFPLTEPYTALGYVHVGGGGEMIAPAILGASGNDAIVDWVLLELRDASVSGAVIASRSALVQRDGDVVDVDGTSPVAFNAVPGTYRVAVRHRNHLGAMTLNSVPLSQTPTTVDLATASTITYGTTARKSFSGVYPVEALWSGDVNFDGQIKYTGSFNDRDPVLQAIGGLVPTNTVSGYLTGDVNLDGVVKYTGSVNDRDPILQNIGGALPTMVRSAQLP